jgi:hypothetical protein
MKPLLFDYEIILEGNPDEVLGRLAHLELGAAAYMAAVAKYPDRNIRLLQGERIIRRHDGAPEPKPEPPTDPNLKSWSVHLIGGKKMQHLGFVHATGEQDAIEVALEKFGLDEPKRKRLAVSLTR